MHTRIYCGGHEYEYGYIPDGYRYVLLVVHGFIADGSSWSVLSGVLGSAWVICAPDIHPASPDGASFDSLAREIHSLVDDVFSVYGVAPYIYGYSFGGRLVCEVLMRYPQLNVSGVCLESAGLGSVSVEEKELYRQRAHEWSTHFGYMDDAGKFYAYDPYEYITWWKSLSLFESQKTLPPAVLAAQQSMREGVPAISLYMLTLYAGVHMMHTAEEHKNNLISLVFSGIPLMYIYGSLDTKYAGVAKDLASRIDAYGMLTLNKENNRQPTDDYVHSLPSMMVFGGEREGIKEKFHHAQGIFTSANTKEKSIRSLSFVLACCDNAGHNVHLENPEYVANVLHKFACVWPH
ncbi:MAG: alpha/beta fold hydrolase [Actinomycetaceae bacterium]|nr:alpha/beta fold hydrolase [Actinomycetaceae bacterium]